jgi:hypothetical protein
MALVILDETKKVQSGQQATGVAGKRFVAGGAPFFWRWISAACLVVHLQKIVEVVATEADLTLLIPYILLRQIHCYSFLSLEQGVFSVFSLSFFLQKV